VLDGARLRKIPTMTDLWILALTVGLFGAAAWFVRLCERM
jgi:hypothetical protein